MLDDSTEPSRKTKGGNMRRVFIVTSLFIIVCLTLTPVEKAGAADDSAASGAAVRGQKLYMQNMCYTCHGTVGQEGERTGPKLAPNPFPYRSEEHTSEL